ncbi:type II secretion system protein N [Aliikangiella marina]|uniref:Type II secretion system protein N n=1 Tax=Aliikangiella marina TaxID=1712262 RepID=A0A545T9P5_9GAMM|nr:type II secretion system protein N [Aliikangiella marina]TQV73928.1 type II secretion system protein N [Aliikangiella marina]
MKKKIFILVSLFLILVVAFTPAKLLLGFLPDRSPFSLNGVSGTVWSGEVSQVAVNQLSFRDVLFSVDLLSLVMFSPSVSLDIASGDMAGDLVFHLTDDPSKNIEVSDVNINFSGKELKRFLPLPGLEVKGDFLTKDLDFVSENQKPKSVDGTVRWQSAEVSYAGQSFTLGDFIIRATTDEEKKIIKAEVLKSKNALDLQGDIILQANGMVEITGSISTEIDQTLYTAFALFNNGKPNNGRLPIKFKQRIFR